MYLCDLFGYVCMCGWFVSGVMLLWEFECDGEVVNVDLFGLLFVCIGGVIDFVVDVVVVGVGIVYFYEDWLCLYFVSGVFELVLEDWWWLFFGLYFYYLGWWFVLVLFWVFIDFIKVGLG